MDGVAEPLIWARAVHFAATLSLSGVVFFVVCIAAPAVRRSGGPAGWPGRLGPRLRWIAWVALLLSVISGAAWLMLVARAMSGSSWADVFSPDVLGTVLLQTSFGRVWLGRFVIVCLIAVLLGPFLTRQRAEPKPIDAAVAALAAGLVGTLAWAGHAVGAPGIEGVIHPAADVLHLVAAAAWVGALLPLALLLAAAAHDPASLAVARIATARFSNYGIGSVATLLVTGSINTWYLAGSIPALTETNYGRLLLAKIALFLVMVAIAAINRLRLTPRLVAGASTTGPAAALRQLRANATIEVIAGAVIIGIVAVLGTSPPGFEAILHGHHSH